MINKFFLDNIPELRENWQTVSNMFTEIEVPEKTVILAQGDIARNMYFINDGVLRLWMNEEDGKDITFQFFLKNKIVTSLDSFINGEPSNFTLEAIKPARLMYISKVDFQNILEMYPKIKNYYDEFIVARFAHYRKSFLGQIKNNPEQRYLDLLESQPDIFDYVPHYYIASYLGITNVSLSRIRGRNRKN